MRGYVIGASVKANLIAPVLVILAIVVLAWTFARKGPDPWRAAFRGWLRASHPPQAWRERHWPWLKQVLQYVLPVGVVLGLSASLLPKAWTLTFLFAFLFLAAVVMGVRVQKQANDAATKATADFKEMSDQKDAAIAVVVKREDQRVTAVREEYEAKLAERAEMNVQHEMVPLVEVGPRDQDFGVPTRVFLVAVVFHNHGPSSEFRAVIRHRSVEGLPIEGIYPSGGDFELRWQHPNHGSWQPIIEGANARAEIAWVCQDGTNRIRFLGPGETRWKIVSGSKNEDEAIRGIIELQDVRGARQQWAFWIWTGWDVPQFDMKPLKLPQ